MTFKIIQGDLFDPAHNFDALAQGVNTQGVMGAGIAVPFRTKWPVMYTDYQKRCAQFGDALAGLVHIYRDDYWPYHPAGKRHETIYNLFSQIMPGRNGDYRLLQQAAISMLLDTEEMGYGRVGLPWIGCGIAGLARHNVQHILEAVFKDSNVEFILVEQPES